MLNIVVRAAVDRMDKLDSFRWELNTKMLGTVYQGLALRPSLTSLSIKFPSLRLPRPSIVIPPMPHLRALKVTDIDPLCYPDDISLLLLQSRNLRDLKLHWSPRMRYNAEPSIVLNAYFGRCIAANYSMPLEHFAAQNLFALHDAEIDQVINPKTIRSFTSINNKGGSQPQTAFVDDTWLKRPPKVVWDLEMIRDDAPSEIVAELISRGKGLRRLYLIDPKRSAASTHSLITTATITPPDSYHVYTPPSAPENLDECKAGLTDLYLDALTTAHGESLRHLLLPAQWPLDETQIAKLVRGCPNLSQLGLAVEVSKMSVVRLLVPFLVHLVALRLMRSCFMDSKDDEEHLVVMRSEMALSDKPAKLRWMELGSRVWEIGGIYWEGDEKRRMVRRISWEVVPEPNIWSMDTLEI
ncbi:MAG: hypothetical protein M1836_003868 [Candelina mexicana]|nr:MAG: hypothetical protein M1836_003868 [Candelina mexicana]